MSKCHVPKCSSKKKATSSASDHQESVTFHQFPIKIELKRRWLKFLGQNLKTDTGNLFICSRHFRESDYADPKPPLSSNWRKRFKAGAVPSIRNPRDLQPEQRRNRYRKHMDNPSDNRSDQRAGDRSNDLVSTSAG